MASKTCFVTIGATASFSALVQAVLTTSFVVALDKQGYGELLVQYGADGKELYETALKCVQGSSVKISGFDLDKTGLGRYMRQAKDSNGVVISHAGRSLGKTEQLHAHAPRFWHDTGRSANLRPNHRRPELRSAR